MMLCLSGELRAKTPRNEGKTGAESESEGDHWGDTTTRAWWGFRSGFPAEAALSSQHFPCPTCATSVSHPCHPHVPSVPPLCPTRAIPMSHPCHPRVPPVPPPCPTCAVVLQPSGHLLRGGLVPERAAQPGLAAGGLEATGHPGILAGSRDSLFLGGEGGNCQGSGTPKCAGGRQVLTWPVPALRGAGPGPNMAFCKPK